MGLPPTCGTDGSPGPRREPTRCRTGAKLLVTDGRRVLLIREQRHDGSTFWTLPGGGIDPGEPLTVGLRREIDEELRCGCTIGRLIATCTYRHTTLSATSTSYAVFNGGLCSPPSPNPREGITDWAWFVPGDLPASLLEPFRRVVSGLLSELRPAVRRFHDSGP